tara:strand:+ start:545 stop:820 length:276 start_codon:yes stop_codon:yes gene_type:complete
MERLFQNSRFLVIIAIITTAISSLLVYIACVNIVFNVVKVTITALPDSAKGGKELIVELLKNSRLITDWYYSSSYYHQPLPAIHFACNHKE